MQARQPFWRRFVVYNKGQNPSYTTRMVSRVGVKLLLHIEFLSGLLLAPSATHLMPSVEVSQKVELHRCLCDINIFSERHTWYRAPDYIPWKQLYLPWLSGLWIWCNWGVGTCLEIHREEVNHNWTQRSVTCNLVSVIGFSETFQLIKGFIGTAYPWTALALSYLLNLSSSIKGQGMVSAEAFPISSLSFLQDYLSLALGNKAWLSSWFWSFPFHETSQ